MRLKRKYLSLNLNTYDGLNELRKQYKCSFGEIINRYVPMPFFDAVVSIPTPAPPKRKVTISIKKPKYNYTADLEDFNKNKCKTLNIQPMKSPRKKQVLKSEYDPQTQSYIDSIESNQPWLKKYRKKVVK